MESAKGFEDIKERILRERLLDVNQFKENYIKRRLAVRMRALQIKEYADYVRYLDSNKREYDILFDKLTVNVTQFFRDPEVFIEFENTLLPELLGSGADDIKIWSAGCSSGEEPYSIAISILETCEKNGIKADFEIEATDIDDASLYKAVCGKYDTRAMENIAENRRDKYFNKNPDNTYTVKDAVKRKVKFIRHNLMHEYKKDVFDFVLCRNVIIYFTRELQKTVLDIYHKSLKKGGVLILGKTETMLLDFRDRYECINIKERIFRKAEKR